MLCCEGSVQLASVAVHPDPQELLYELGRHAIVRLGNDAQAALLVIHTVKRSE